jgi:hypothetical protein
MSTVNVLYNLTISVEVVEYSEAGLLLSTLLDVFSVIWLRLTGTACKTHKDFTIRLVIIVFIYDFDQGKEDPMSRRYSSH